VLGAAVALRRRSRGVELVPAQRVVAAAGHVTHLARGLGLRRRPPETDREWLARIGRSSAAAATLAEVTARARYAPTTTDEDARAAEQAASVLEDELLRGVRPLRRPLVLLRGRLAAPLDRLRARSSSTAPAPARPSRPGG
jgi:hypothetical protein